ncbi:hypothetical protein JYU34_012771 [Plutella xylostella]|uniref:Globin domain-containing protein n=1 Tax=Plutella xylostella TaxID=51655 RepID=A0ABQ7QDG4_PLUXY|nr:hypothetical protein JYU34_012771 [Plutella xylostella]
MGGWLSYLWWGGAPDVADPVSGLSRRDIYAVQKSWAPVYNDSVGNGTELLKRLFRTYPDTKEFFRMIRNVPEEEYISNPQFKAHVINLMSSLNMAISCLHQPEVVVAMMHKIGESHNGRHIQEKHFNELTDVIVTMFTEVLHLDEATLASWGRTVAFWYKAIFDKLDKTNDTR